MATTTMTRVPPTDTIELEAVPTIQLPAAAPDASIDSDHSLYEPDTTPNHENERARDPTSPPPEPSASFALHSTYKRVLQSLSLPTWIGIFIAITALGVGGYIGACQIAIARAGY